MIINDCVNLTPKGEVEINFISKKNGKIINYVNHNLVVNEGRRKIVDLLLDKANITKMVIKKDSSINENTVPPSSQATDTFSSVFGNSYILSAIRNISGVYEDDEGKALDNPKIQFVSIFDCDNIDCFVNQIGLVIESEGVNYLFALFSLDRSYDLRADQDMIIQVIWRISF